jgi:hypothetical protein
MTDVRCALRGLHQRELKGVEFLKVLAEQLVFFC